MLKKIKSFIEQYAIISALIIYLVLDLFLLGLGRLLSLLPWSLGVGYLNEIILVTIPIAVVFLFGFSRAFKNGSVSRAVICCVPLVVMQIISFAVFLSENLGNPETNWLPWYLIIYEVFTLVCVGVREECIYRATIQNVVAKKYANSVKGIWITVITSSIIFGLTHITNLFFGMDPLAVFTQMMGAACLGLVFGAVYLRSGNLWVMILIHATNDIVALANSTFLKGVSGIQDLNSRSFSWGSLVVNLAYIGYAAFLLRPSKCRQICESFCFAGEKAELAE